MNTRWVTHSNWEMGADCAVLYGVIAFDAMHARLPTFWFGFGPSLDGFARFSQPPEPELDFGSGSALMPNFGPDLGLVH